MRKPFRRFLISFGLFLLIGVVPAAIVHADVPRTGFRLEVLSAQAERPAPIEQAVVEIFMHGELITHP